MATVHRHVKVTHERCRKNGVLAEATANLVDAVLQLLAAHPPLLHDLKGGLYPLAARRHGLRPDAVERSLRLAVESTWMRGSLPGMERFFGHSVDPERGKPTNREFLFRLQEHLTLAARRFQ